MSTSSARPARHRLAWLLWPQLALVCAASLMAWTGTLPVVELGALDKVGHFVMIGAVALLLDLWLRGRRIGGVSLAVLVMLVVSVTDECAQAWSPLRTFDSLDLAANCAGVLLAGWLAQRLRARAARRPSSVAARLASG